MRLDLNAAGLYVAPPAPLSDEDQGVVVAYIDDHGQVIVDWLPHARLDRVALDMVEADRTDDEPVVRSAVDTALGTILTGFGYTTRRPDAGFGHIVLDHTRKKGIRPCPHPRPTGARTVAVRPAGRNSR